MGIAAGMKDIVQDIVSSYDARVAEVKELKKEAREMIDSFQTSHQEMGAQLRRELADDKAKMEAEVKAMLKSLGQDKAEMAAEVRTMRKGFQTSHKEMSTELKKGLTQGVAVRKPEVKDMLNDFRNSHQQTGTQLRRELADYERKIKSEVAGMRREIKADMGKARAAWQELTRQVKKATVETGILDLETKLLTAIREHPEGIALTQIAKSLGIAPIVLGRAAKRLVDGGRVRKEDKLYFLAGTERG